jgi:PAS domain S-box-containing protein
VSILVVVVLLVVSGVISLHGFRNLHENRLLVSHAHKVLMTLERTESVMKDAETGQRGFIITGREEYLEPFHNSMAEISDLLTKLSATTSQDTEQQILLSGLKTSISERILELKKPIAARREFGFESAQQIINTDLGMQSMERVRSIIRQMRTIETDLMNQREAVAQRSYESGFFTSFLSSTTSLFLVGAVLYLIGKNKWRAERSAAEIYAERERLRVTLASIGDGVVTTDRHGKITFLNSVSERLTNWAEEDARSKPIDQVLKIVMEDRVPLENPAIKALREGDRIEAPKNSILISRLGEEIPIDDVTTPIRDANGEIDGAVLVFRDASARRRVELQLLNSAAFTRRIVDGLSQMVIVLDSESKILTINEKTRTIFSVAELQAKGVELRHFASGAFDRTEVKSLLESITARDENRHSVEFEILSPELGQRSVLLEAIRLDEPLNLQGAFLLVVTDRTDEQELLKQNRRLDQHMRWFLEQISDYAIFTMDTECRAMSWNQGVKKVLGYTEDEFLGQDVRHLIFTPESIEDGSAYAEFETAAREGEAHDDRWMMRKDQIRFWASGMSNAILDEHGNLAGFSKIMRDLTDRKNYVDQLGATVERLSIIEGRHRLALDAAELGTWNMIPVSGDLITDARFRAIFGVAGETLTLDDAFATIHPEDHERVRTEVANATRSIDPVPYSSQYRVVHPDNSVHWVYSKGATHFESTGKDSVLVSFDGTIADITQQKKADDELRRLAAELSEADRRKNEFLATLAHELRNPLAPIKNAVQLMGMTNLDSDTEELRQTMERQVEQLVRLIDDLLDMSRISRGRIELRRQVVDLASIMDAAVEASATFIRDSGQKLIVQCQRDEIFASVDPARIAQVVCNLLNNSSKYSHAGSNIELTVKAADGHAIIEVTDNGVGIETDRLQDIFQMFTQVDDSVERGTAGLGIGLSLVKTFVELHGGRVFAESDGLNLGSRFTVLLPLADRLLQVVPVVELLTTIEPRSFKILVVEDQRALRVVLTRLLERMGHQVVAVDSGMAAIRMLDEYHPELIFSDISMPGMTGYELVSHLRKREDTRKLYMVAMTGFGQKADRELATESGFDEHMVKPVDVERLREMFRRVQIDR